MNLVELGNLVKRRPVSALQLYALARELELRGDWLQLQRIFLDLRNDVLPQSKLIGFVDYTLANCSFHRGDWVGALELAQSSVGVEPDFPFSHHVLGQCLAKLDRTECAIASLQRCCYLAPSFAWGWYELGLVLIREGKWHEGRIALVRAKSCFSNSSTKAKCAEAKLIENALVELGQSELLAALSRVCGQSITDASAALNINSLDQAEAYLLLLTGQLDNFEIHLRPRTA